MKVRLLILFFFILSYSKAQRVPNTETFHLWNITDVIYGDHNSGRNLRGSFTASTPSYFNSTYAALYSANSMLRFRDYGPTSAPPTYSFSSYILDSFGNTNLNNGDNVWECQSIEFKVVTTNVPNGTNFIFNVAGMWGHFNIVGHPGVGTCNVQILNNEAKVQVVIIPDRIIETPSGITMELYLESDNSKTILRNLVVNDKSPTWEMDYNTVLTLCGSWGPFSSFPNVSNISQIQVSAAKGCPGFNYLHEMRLYNMDVNPGSPRLLRTWSYSEMTDENYFSANVIEPVVPVGPNTRAGYRYNYKFEFEDIYGNVKSIEKYIGCNVYAYTNLINYNVDKPSLQWHAYIKIFVVTNAQYLREGYVMATNEDPQDPLSSFSKHDFGTFEPYTGYAENTIYQPSSNCYELQFMNNSQIYFHLNGALFSADCGEQVSNSFVSQREPIGP